MIAIVGRPNVGKSTLFNRLLGRRTTVVSPTPGTTRDRVYGRLEWRGHPLTLIDTGGFDLSPHDDLSAAIQAHVRRALQEADGVLFLCDAQQGLVPMDELVMDALRKTGKPVILAANKADQRLAVPPDLFALGLSPVFPISALHGRGIGELLDYLTDRLAAGPPAPSSSMARPGDRDRRAGARPAAVAIVGRPNVGKSSLLNALLREERVIVSEVPGTTRDAIDTPLMFDGVPVTLIDTAGLRHRRKVKSPVELFAMSRALEAIDRCDVALAVLDATQGVTQDDRRLLTKIIAKGRGLVLLLNKWDLVSGPRRSSSGARLREDVRRTLPFAAFAPVLAVSATTGFQVERSLRIALSVVRAMRQGLPERALLSTLQRAWAVLPPPRSRGRVIRLEQARWVAGPPCRVVITTSPAARLPFPFQRVLLKRLQAHPTLIGVPLVLDVPGASGARP